MWLAALQAFADAGAMEEVVSSTPPPLVVPPMRLCQTRRPLPLDRFDRDASQAFVSSADAGGQRGALSKKPPSQAAAEKRPYVARILIEELFLGNDPMQHFASGLVEAARPVDEHMTHVSPKDVDMVLASALQPVTFWLELGSFEGGSAILAAQRAKARASQEGMQLQTTVVAVDTFLGDFHVLWGRPPEDRAQLLRPDGTVTLYDKFRANVLQAGDEDVILPMPATSITALRVFAKLAAAGTVPAPQVIYLDSSHAEGEVLLELQLAWRTVAPGGVVFGDDWVLPVGEDRNGEVQRDVLRFAEAHQMELDDDFGPAVQSMRTLGRPRPGLFVSYQSFQWFIRKPVNAAAVDSKPVKMSPLARGGFAPSQADAGFDCWSDGYSKEDCCDEQRHGVGGNPSCWDLVFTYEQCCSRGG